MKDLGKVNQFLGVKIVQIKDNVFINHSAFIKSLLQKHNFENCKPVSTPVDVSNMLEVTDENDELVYIDKYQSAVSGLVYLSTRTRPDRYFVASNVTKYCFSLSFNHWIAVKTIFRYLKRTFYSDISYEKHNVEICIGCSEADCVGDKSDRKI